MQDATINIFLCVHIFALKNEWIFFYTLCWHMDFQKKALTQNKNENRCILSNVARWEVFHFHFPPQLFHFWTADCPFATQECALRKVFGFLPIWIPSCYTNGDVGFERRFDSIFLVLLVVHDGRLKCFCSPPSQAKSGQLVQTASFVSVRGTNLPPPFLVSLYAVSSHWNLSSFTSLIHLGLRYIFFCWRVLRGLQIGWSIPPKWRYFFSPVQLIESVSVVWTGFNAFFLSRLRDRPGQPICRAVLLRCLSFSPDRMLLLTLAVFENRFATLPACLWGWMTRLLSPLGRLSLHSPKIARWCWSRNQKKKSQNCPLSVEPPIISHFSLL